MNRGRKQPRDDFEGSEIFSDAEFDADDFVEDMDEKQYSKKDPRAGWRRLEELHENRQLQKQLNDFGDWEDFE